MDKLEIPQVEVKLLVYNSQRLRADMPNQSAKKEKKKH